MNRVAWLALTLLLTSCSTNGTALEPLDGSAGTGGGGTGTGGDGGGPGRGRPDGSIQVTGGTGGDTGGTGGNTGGNAGTGGATGGTGGSVMPDAGPMDAGKSDGPVMVDAGNGCQACTALLTEYAEAVRKEQVCNPMAANQCLKQTPNRLVCGCSVWVTTTVLSDEVRMRFQAAGCLKCTNMVPCPAIACVNPGTGACVPVMAAGDPPGGAAPIVAPPPPQAMGQCMSKF